MLYHFFIQLCCCYYTKSFGSQRLETLQWTFMCLTAFLPQSNTHNYICISCAIICKTNFRNMFDKYSLFNTCDLASDLAMLWSVFQAFSWAFVMEWFASSSGVILFCGCHCFMPVYWFESLVCQLDWPTCEIGILYINSTTMELHYSVLRWDIIK